MHPSPMASTTRIILPLLLICGLLAPTLAPAAPRGRSKTELQSRLANTRNKISKVRQKLAAKKRQAQHTRTRLAHVSQQVRVARGQYHALALQLDRKKAELHRAKLNLADAKLAFSGAQHDAGKRLVAIYERGEQGNLELLVSAKDMGDLLQRSELAGFVADQDRESLNNLKEHKERLARLNQQVAQRTTEVAQLTQRAAVQHEVVNEKRIGVQHQLSAKQREVYETQAELNALERDSREVASMLRRMQSSSGGKRRYNTSYTGPVGGLPVRGRISSGFGYRTHPVFRTRKLHTGIDIAAPMGTPIVTTGGGEVIYAGWRGGYGNAVIIDHGRGKATLYGHMSSIAVGNGQVVKRGQLIGRVGSTGISTGPHCHYEVRINGQPVNPR
ncbi:MAG: murein hydrolase activator EnvC family protein [Armatimonadota bacterium]